MYKNVKHHETSVFLEEPQNHMLRYPPILWGPDIESCAAGRALGFATHRDGGGKRPIPAAAAVLDRTSEWRGKFGNTHGSKGWWTKAKQGKMGASSARQDENRNMGEVEWKRWTYISIYVYIIYVYNIIYIYIIYILYIYTNIRGPACESTVQTRSKRRRKLEWPAGTAAHPAKVSGKWSGRSNGVIFKPKPYISNLYIYM